MSNENEFGFTPDTPEAYQAAEAAGTENEFGVVNDAPLPPADDIDDEVPAGDVPPTPVATATPVAAAPVAAAVPADFDRRTPIQGLREDADLSLEGTALETKKILMKQPKVRMMIPLDPGEKAGAYRTVVINGYRFDVRKNTMVDLPQSVASLLSDAYQITSDVLENNPLNLNRADSEKRRALGMA